MSEQPIEIGGNNHKKNKFWKIKNLFVKGIIIFKSIHSQGNFLKYLFSKKGLKLFYKFLIKISSIITGKDSNTQIKAASYQNWLLKNSPNEATLLNYKEKATSFAYQPKISVIVPVYNTPRDFLVASIESVIAQVYPNWELCLADDNSNSPDPASVMKEYAAKDPRIKTVFRKENGHISECSNSALDISTGEFCVLFDHDDLLTKDALYQMVVLLNNKPEADFVYSDEDKTIDGKSFEEPTFKPQWSPDNLLSRNYIGHLTMIRSSLIKELGGFRKEFNGSQDYDLFLRATEKTKNIYHLPKVLYHWRMHENSVAANTYSKPYAYIAGQKAIEEALLRRGTSASVEILEEEMLGFYSIRYLIDKTKKVSIVIPAKNKSELLEQCVHSIFKLSTYANFEVIVVDNGSDEEKFLELVKRYEQQYQGKFKCYRHDIPFNFSSLINFGVSKTSGDYIILLNNDTRLITKDWIEKMMEVSQRPQTAVVGVKLLFPNNTIQHAGVVIEPSGNVRHIYSGLKKDVDHIYINSVNNYPALTGACFMVRREIFHELGGFDEDFAVEYNDIDFCLKALKAGYYNLYIPSVELYHYESISRGRADSSGKKYERFLYEHNQFTTTWKEYIDQYTNENSAFLEFN